MSRTKKPSGKRFYLTLIEDTARSILNIVPTNQYQQNPHFSIMEFVLPQYLVDIIDVNMFMSNLFPTIQQLFYDHLGKYKFEFLKYEILGNHNMLAAIYQLCDNAGRPGQITPFRTAVYQLIAKELAINKYTFHPPTYKHPNHHVMVSDTNIPILYVPIHSFGVEVYLPHMTLCSLTDLRIQKPEIYDRVIVQQYHGDGIVYSINRRNIQIFDKSRPKCVILSSHHGRRLVIRH